MPISDKNCSFEYSEKDPAQNDKYVPKKGTGTIVSEPFVKTTEKGNFLMVAVLDSSNGKVREVFASGLEIK